MDGPKIEQRSFSKRQRTRIAESLPNTLAPAHREALTAIIEKHIQTWVEIKPQIAPHREKLRGLTAETVKLQAAVERTKAAVAKLLGTDPAAGMRNSYTAENDLHAIASRAANDLAAWNRHWRPKKARPRAFAVQLTKALQDDYRLFCGNLLGFSQLLQVIRVELPTLPELISSTLAKRKQRSR